MRELPYAASEIVTQKDIALGSVSFQGRNFGRPAAGKAQERRVSITFTTANAPTVAYHGLGKIPSGYTVVSSGIGTGAPGTVYNDMPLPCDSRTLVVKCSTAGTTAEIIVR